MFFIFPSGPSASFANRQLTSVDSCNWHLPPTNCLSQHAVLVFRLLPPPLPPLATGAASALLHPPPPPLSTALPSSSSAAAVCSHCELSLSADAVSAAASTAIHAPHPLLSEAVVHSHRQLPLSVVAAYATTNVLHSAATIIFHSRRCFSASSATFGISPKR